MPDRITKEFFETGVSFEKFLEDATKEQNSKYTLYYKKAKRNYTPEDFKVGLTNPVNIIALGATWCFDSQVYLPLMILFAEHNPQIQLKIFNKDHYPFLAHRINGGKKVPQALLFTKDFFYLGNWIERPTNAYQLVAEKRDIHGWKKENFEPFQKDYRSSFLRRHKEFEDAFIQEFKALLVRSDWIQKTTARFFVKSN